MQSLSAQPVRIFAIMRAAAVRRVVLDVLLVLAAVAVLMVVSRVLEQQVPRADVSLVLALFTAAAGTGAAQLAVLAARLTWVNQVGWISLMLGCYSLLAIPTATIDALAGGRVPAVVAVRFLVNCLVVALLAVALIAPAPPTRRRAVATVLGSAAVVTAAGSLASAFPATAQAITNFQPLRLGVDLAWIGLALAIAVIAARRQAWGLCQVGAGIAMLGAALAGHVGGAASPAAEPGLISSSVHLLAIALVLRGTLRLAHEALLRLDDENAAHEEELRLAGIRLARATERDHELRSGLAGLAGATTLLGADRPDTALLTTAVTSELHRLDDLLTAPVGTRSHADEAIYAVAPVLDGLVALRRTGGMDIRLDVDSGIRAIGSSTVLAQVITNLLGNAALHAPGSPVRISVTRRDERIVICVRDFGPGVPAGSERAVLEPGVRDRSRPGHGLGLHICRGLLAAEKGSIAIRTADPQRPGCTVLVELLAAPSPSRYFSPSSVRCTAS